MLGKIMLKKINFLLYSALIFVIGCDESTDNNADELLCGGGSYTTKNIMTNISEEIYNDDESVKAYSRYAWSSDGSSRILPIHHRYKFLLIYWSLYFW